MRQIIYRGDNNVDIVDTEDQSLSPPPNHVTVDVHAIGINFADIMAKKGMYSDAPSYPYVVGYEFAGVVSECGTDVDASWLNKPVFGMSKFGAYSDRINVPIVQVYEKPSKLSMAEAASIPVVYLTAYFAAITLGGLRKGETILMQNVGGGLGLAVLDIALHEGATVIGTASARKHPLLMERGLHHVIDYTKEDYVEKVKEITNGNDVDVVIDSLGPAYWRNEYNLLSLGGRLVMTGVSQLSENTSFFGKIFGLIKFLWQLPWFGVISLINDNKAVAGCNMGRAFKLVATKGPAIMQYILDGIEQGWIRPHVDSEWPMEKVIEAQAQLEQRKNFGKVVMVTSRSIDKSK